jgi:hypothetical protein
MNEAQPSTPWIGPIFQPAIKRGGTGFNTLELKVARRQLDVFVDHVKVVPTLTFDWDVTPARVGLAVDCQVPPVRAEYDRVKITELSGATSDDSNRAGTSQQPIRVANGGGLVLADGTWVFAAAHLKILNKSGGAAYAQTNMNDFPAGLWTCHRQLFWNGPKMGDTLALEIPIDAAGNYEVYGRFTRANDYGRTKLELDRNPLLAGKYIDLFSTDVRPTDLVSLGAVSVGSGKARLTATIVGKNRSAKRYNFGIDEIRFVPIR